MGDAKSATGRPIVAGDPHRLFDIPSMYAQHHVACDAFDMIGLTVPGVPGFPHFAHNGKVAFCVTIACMDLHDLYLEQFDADGSKVRYEDGWEETRTRTDRISVRGGADRHFEITATRHGPVIAGDPRKGSALALKSVQFAETDLSFNCLPRMTRASSVAELYEATRGWGLVDHNLVAGDTHGSIGHLVRARVPKRSRENGWLPVPGWTGRNEWLGWIAHEEMPCVINPADGIIVTANNRVVPDEYPHYLCTDCQPSGRAKRILELVKAALPFRVEDAAPIHADTLSPNALLFKSRLEAIGPLKDTQEENVRRTIVDWDGHMDESSYPAHCYNELRRALTKSVTSRCGLSAATEHPFARFSHTVSPETRMWWVVPTLIRNDDTALLGGASWDEAIVEALSTLARTVKHRTWGEAHQPKFMHPLSQNYRSHAELLDPPSRPMGGDDDTVLCAGFVPSTGSTANYGSLSRYVFDVGNWDNSQWIVFHGTSGHPGSPHYADQGLPWSACKMVPMRYDWKAIVATATSEQTLLPQQA